MASRTARLKDGCESSEGTEQNRADPIAFSGNLLREIVASGGRDLFQEGQGRLKVSVITKDGTEFSIEFEGALSSPAVNAGGTYSDHLGYALKFAGRSIEDLDLAPKTKAAARELLEEFGASITFTSGRRSVEEQSRAMAQNIVSTGDRNWIEKTYLSGAELQEWVNQHPGAVTVGQLTKGLESVMATWDAEKRTKLSHHLSGSAFDMRPVSGGEATRIREYITTKLFDLHKFLDGEAGVQVWHLQFTE